jgi:hypothetical protein
VSWSITSATLDFRSSVLGAVQAGHLAERRFGGASRDAPERRCRPCMTDALARGTTFLRRRRLTFEEACCFLTMVFLAALHSRPALAKAAARARNPTIFNARLKI